MHFIINNITSMNIEQKVKELKAQVAPDYWPWFANYLVVKRAAQVRPVVGGWVAADCFVAAARFISAEWGHCPHPPSPRPA